MTTRTPEPVPAPRAALAAARRGTLWRRLRLRDEGGQALVVAMVAMVAVIGMAGLALDVGHAYVEQQTVQAAADSAALAGADDLPGSAATAISDATAYAARNQVQNGVDGTTVQVFSPPQDSKNLNGNPYSVEVLVSRAVPTLFLGAVNIGSITVTGHAVATSDAISPCALCILGRTGQTLAENGDYPVSVTGAGLQINSSSAQAAVLNGSADVTATQIGIVGGYSTTGSGSFVPVPQTGVAPVPDPLARLQPPALAGPSYGDVTISNSTDITLQPGIYGSIVDDGNNTLTFAPGTYVITGGLTLGGTDTLAGSGVTLYMTCAGYSASDTAPCDGQPGASITVSGSSTVNLSPPTSGAYAGLTIFYDRGNAATLTLNGNAGLVTGTVYALSAAGVFNGKGGVQLNLDSLIIMHSMTLNGNGDINIDYKPSQNYLAIGSSHLTQ